MNDADEFTSGDDKMVNFDRGGMVILMVDLILSTIGLCKESFTYINLVK
jgi:hypothetical protein